MWHCRPSPWWPPGLKARLTAAVCTNFCQPFLLSVTDRLDFSGEALEVYCDFSCVRSRRSCRAIRTQNETVKVLREAALGARAFRTVGGVSVN